MPASNLARRRPATKRRRISSRDLRQAIAEVRAIEREKRERANEIRQTAWCHFKFNRPLMWSWWQTGFAHNYGKRVERSDFTAIPGYDTLAQEMAALFPEYSDDDGCARQWDFLLSPYETLPPRANLVRQAKQLLRDRRRQPATEICNDPF